MITNQVIHCKVKQISANNQLVWVLYIIKILYEGLYGMILFE